MTTRAEAFEDAVWASQDEIEERREREAYEADAYAQEAERDQERREDEERMLDPTDRMSDFYYTDVALQMRRDAGIE